MDQEQIMRAANIEREARVLEENLQFVDNQIAELENFKEGLLAFSQSEEKEMLSPFGKRVYIKTKVEDKDKLFVEVGAGVIVKKTPTETIKIVEGQVSRLKEARNQIANQLAAYQIELEAFIRTMQEES